MTAPNTVLTLAFEKAATQQIQIFHPWRYFVAGGETLTKIEQFIADFANVEKARADLCAQLGAKSFDGTYGFRFDFNPADMVALEGTELIDIYMSGDKGSEPFQSKRVLSIPDFVIADGRAFGQCHPDVATERGREIRAAAMAIEEMAKPAQRFAKWLGAFEVAAPKDINNVHNVGGYVKLSAIATKVGDEWIVAVPVGVKLQDYTEKTYTESWVTPPGSAPLTISQYFARMEKANLLKNTPPGAGK